MRTIERTTQFRRDYKRESKGRYRAILEEQFAAIVVSLASDAPLSERYHDHPLTGTWLGYRDCHIKPDLVLVYRKPDNDLLELTRLGSHSELGF